MKELINEAENIRAKLLEVMLNIPYDFEPDYTIAITLAADFLKKLIERKDNIVDLSELWHNKNTKPEINKLFVFQDEYDEDFFFTGFIDPDMPDDVTLIDPHTDLDELCHLDKLIKWAYVDDLLPKGGE